MAKTFTPPFVQTPKVTFGTIATANTAKDGTGAVVCICTAGADGAKVDQIKVRGLGTNVATVLRFFVNNGGVNSTATNNTLVHEVTIPATTVSEISALADIDVTITKGADVFVPIPYLPALYKINMTIGTAVAAGLHVTCWSADY